jgi:hypothetical protein
MAGLDPAIHLFSESLTKMVDHRVKPGDDAGVFAKRSAPTQPH